MPVRRRKDRQATADQIRAGVRWSIPFATCPAFRATRADTTRDGALVVRSEQGLLLIESDAIITR
jgi:hypothetical protein